jgi:hypothetical protein
MRLQSKKPDRFDLLSRLFSIAMSEMISCQLEMGILTGIPSLSAQATCR